METKQLTVARAAKALKAREFSAVELTEQFLENITAENPNLNAYLEIFEDSLEQAKHADEILGRGEGGVLTGIPIAVKDNILIEGKIASAASKMLENYRAAYDATVIRKLKEQGAVFLGRTNMDEFAMGGSTENSAFGATKNPHDTERVAGGTSGGSAAAVAADMTLAALGSDTGGSVRQPASFCGVVGLKPTYGAVSRFGLIATVSSFDQIGPLTKTVEDAGLMFGLISGIDPKDSTTLLDESRQTSEKEKMTVGIPRHLFKEGVDAGVLQAFEKMAKKLSDRGHRIVDIELPSISYALSCYYVINFAEISSNLARFDGVRYGLHVDGIDLLGDYTKTRGAGFGTEVRRRILLGTYVLSAGYYDAYYGKANTVRQRITNDFLDAFKTVDCIATPTTPFPAFRFGEKNDPLAMYAADIFTVPANLTGMPALSVPMDPVVRDGATLPVGFQLTAPHRGEPALFHLGKILEI
ncbi:glutaminyl-tRNA synthase (glutamine-hydrolyzing) subunit A [Candidatus Kaiserbacteria bacterium RIFCSPHIGHO2_02_FULL_50_9]|uniref:Glutamyl-tRNA(Gln) amidotransferase subunit A n=1 Tax=Candidatus Kaiserbacteria bacterium RIFCSPLOWO2_01_FULL_51_21 TaxID=1798508 RepID=A0A1F6ECS0_9BACT|nr:MAG: glutaminyl-tRNA synthase (glutamine-hydrolyzing) subunit A [Candidatus Kaiserbacteria bacterium RIFCSPHIGHO2_01_FULL_51_33]OGG63482.1 MAG: glutaminyl-tRNA synthase (glutamine-hydrolyzing) subunit A [Candidatus Kaiserbacteria bacterium RIFCSPHIGHO2_02_FULL_50_9]OGG71475.1 MAG: glutaminyl-tRNA synthase (glutamine-hydrolyzing) subunit A [Candidatus Kaiserbacteria bacterium RIFCSPLOWO2_01_FULL_51_21]